MNAIETAEFLVRLEKERRAETRLAVLAVVERADPASSFTLSELRRQVALYYGKALADGALVAELIGFAAEAGGWTTAAHIWNVKLRPPSRAERKRIADKWNKELPPGELPMIQRPIEGGARLGGATEEALIDRVPGLAYSSHGIHRQAPDPETVATWRTGGGGAKRGGTVQRRRRFPDYIARLSAYLERGAVVSAVDRQLIEFVIEGRSLQWIADELQMTKANVHKRVAGVRKMAGIAGPGPGR